MAAGRDRTRFGLFELDPESGELFREGTKVRLQQQPLAVLRALLERPGHVVTREELRDRLWRNDTFVDFDHGLNTAIKKLRAALGDSADNPRFVETLARRGYRFIAPVTVPIAVPDAIPPLPPAATGATSTTPSRRTLVALAGTFALVIVVGAALVWNAWRDAPAAASAVRPPIRLAVLPLSVSHDSAATAEDAYLGIGIADAIITRLANVPGLALHPTGAVLHYANGAPDAEAAARALNVNHLVVGTVQRTSAAYRVSIQLVREGAAIWAQSYDVPRTDLLHLQDSVAEQIVDVLALQLTRLERDRLRRPHTVNPDAYDAYLRGRVRMANYTDANMRLAIADLEQAVRLDPQYALARAALATTLAWFSIRYAYEAEAHEWGERADREAQATLTQDANLGEAHLAIANVAGTLYRGFDWQMVLSETERALALDPTLELAQLGRMRAFYHLGAFGAAREAAARARLLNPAPNVEIDRVQIALELAEGNYAAAREHALQLLSRTDAPAIRNYLGLALFYLGDVPGGRAMLASAMRRGQPDIRSQAALSSVAAAAGDHAEARRVLDFVLSSGYMDHHVAYSVAAAHAQLGQADESIRWLRRAAATGFSCEPWFARDPLLTPLRSNAEFGRLLDQLRGGVVPRGTRAPVPSNMWTRSGTK